MKPLPEHNSMACGEASNFKEMEEKLYGQINSFRNTALIYSAVQLGLADILATKRLSLEELAKQLECNSDDLARFLNALEVIGLIERTDSALVRLTDTGQLLCKDSTSPCRELACIVVEQHWKSWAQLEYSVRNGKPAFEFLMGCNPFEWRSNNPDASRLFNTWLRKETSSYSDSIVDKIRLNDCTKVADVAGGSGGLLVAMLEANSHLQGVLFDQAHVIQQAKQDLINQSCFNRIEFVEGNFFDSVAVDADLLVLKSVVHDWDDSEAVRILKACRTANSGQARLALVERLTGQTELGKETIMLDMAMMSVTGGRERSLDQYEDLMHQAGYCLHDTIECESGFFVMEGLPL